MKLKLMLPLLLGIMLILGPVLSGCASKSDSSSAGTTATGPFVGKLAPDFTLSAIDGQKVTLSDLRGKPVLLNFWTTWCTYCKAELPDLQSVNKEYSDKGLVLLAIDVEEDPSDVKKFVIENRVSLPVLLDTDGIASKTYHIYPLPTSFLIDKNGVIKEVRIGAFSDADDVRASLKKIL